MGKKGRIENGCVIVTANMKKSRNSNLAQVRTLHCRVTDTVFRIVKHTKFSKRMNCPKRKKRNFHVN